MDAADRTQLVRSYRDGPAAVAAALGATDPQLLDLKPSPTDWSVREIVHHLADAEVMAAARLRRLLTEDDASIQGYDEEEYARRLHYDRPVEPALDLLIASRQANADLLDSLDEDDWKRAGRHGQFGSYSVEDLVARAAVHCFDHAAQIRQAFAAVATATANPDDRLIDRLRREGYRGRREYQLLVELSEIKPRIWRRLVISDKTTLPLLHKILQAAFGWQDYHLHLFEVGTVSFSMPDEEDELGHIDERAILINQLLHRPGDRCHYEYDFGDSWIHEIVLEEMRASPNPEAPRCMDGERAAPPEDAGGVSGYERLLTALSDPEDPEHDEFKVWARDFQPERFDREAVNRKLARMVPRPRVRPSPRHGIR